MSKIIIVFDLDDTLVIHKNEYTHTNLPYVK